MSGKALAAGSAKGPAASALPLTSFRTCYLMTPRFEPCPKRDETSGITNPKITADFSGEDVVNLGVSRNCCPSAVRQVPTKNDSHLLESIRSHDLAQVLDESLPLQGSISSS